MSNLRIKLDLYDVEVNELLIAMCDLKVKYRKFLHYEALREATAILDKINCQYKQQIDKAKDMSQQNVKMEEFF